MPNDGREGGTMKRAAIRNTTLIAVFLACLMASPAWAGYKMEFGEHVNAEIGVWVRFGISTWKTERETRASTTSCFAEATSTSRAM
jgi:hypothetical protein